MNKELISIIIVSHGHGKLVADLLDSIEEHEIASSIEVILIDNVKSEKTNITSKKNFKFTHFINNKILGLSKNNNFGVDKSNGKYICILNPDVKFLEPIFEDLLLLINSETADIVTPKMVDQKTEIQDSFRKIPNPFEQILRFLTRRNIRKSYSIKGKDILFPDWIGGMFMLMKKQDYLSLGGFDEKFFLYFEDIDFCCRANLVGLKIAVDLRKTAEHDARRGSRKSLKLFAHHVISSVKFYLSKSYLKSIYRNKLKNL